MGRSNFEKVEAHFDMVIQSNKWEGEDEEEEVMESWEDFDEEKKAKPAEVPKAKPKPKKTLAEKIKEREQREREEAEKKASEKEESLTLEEKRAEMLRRQKLQEESDLLLAMETFSVTERSKGIDGMMPNNAEEFKEFNDALTKKISQFNKHTDYPTFTGDLIKNLLLTLNATSLRKVKSTVDCLYTEKLKMEKAKKKKVNGKAKLKIEGQCKYGDLTAYEYDYDYDDFM